MSTITTTPPKITIAVRRLTDSVVLGAEPIYLPVRPEADAIVHECFPNVQATGLGHRSNAAERRSADQAIQM